MGLLLQSKSIFSEILKLDAVSGDYLIVGRDALNNSSQQGGINGVFDFLGKTLVAIYAIDKQLRLQISDKTIPLGKGLKVAVSGAPSQRLLSIFEPGCPPFTINYDISNSIRSEYDNTPFVDDEDCDFGLFIQNVVQDKSRQQVMLENW